jgi:hypothetical protein
MLVLVYYLRLSGSREYFLVLTRLVVPRDGVLGSPRGRVALGCGVIHCYSLIHCVDIGRMYRYVLLCAANCGSGRTVLPVELLGSFQ